MHNSSALMATAGAESEKNKANRIKREKRKKAMAGVTLNQERDEQEEE